MTVFQEELVLVKERADGAYWDVVLNRPKANILDAAMVAALDDVFVRVRTAPNLKAVCLSGAGDHFCFGASVAEHLPESVGDMLRGFHQMFRVIADAGVTVLAAVRGQCLGGGLELAAYAHRVFASPDARLGQPEINLGVIAPVASVLLSERVGRGMADHLCITGAVLGAEDALAAGLVDEVTADPVASAFDYFERHLQSHSASSLRFAARAARFGLNRRLFADLDGLEELYLQELQATHDAVEGIQAFLAKRTPEWRNE